MVLKGTVYRADKFLQVNMTLLTVLIIVHKYIASRFLPYHRLSFETAVAHAQLTEILSELSSSKPCVIASKGQNWGVDEYENVTVFDTKYVSIFTWHV